MEQAKKVLLAYTEKYDTKLAKEIKRYIDGYEQMVKAAGEMRKRNDAVKDISYDVQIVVDKNKRLEESLIKTQEIAMKNMDMVNKLNQDLIDLEAQHVRKIKKLKGGIASLLVNN